MCKIGILHYKNWKTIFNEKIISNDLYLVLKSLGFMVYHIYMFLTTVHLTRISKIQCRVKRRRRKEVDFQIEPILAWAYF